MNRFRGIKAAVVICLTIMLVLPVHANSVSASVSAVFHDVADSHWGAGNILWAYEKGIVHGDGNGRFRPNDPVAQVEFLAMLSGAFSTELSIEPDPTLWYAPYYQLADQMDLTYIEAPPARLVYSRGDLAVNVYELISASSATEEQAVYFLLNSEISKGKSGKSYKGYEPNDTLTRAEAVTFVRSLQQFIATHFGGELLGGHEIVREGGIEALHALFPITPPATEAPDQPPTAITSVKQTKLKGIALGSTTAALVKSLGKPERIDPTFSKYSWYIYNTDGKHYRYAVADDRVIGFYSNSKDAYSGGNGIVIGVDTYDSASKKLDIVYESFNDDDYITTIYYDPHASGTFVDAILIMSSDARLSGSRAVQDKEFDQVYRAQERGILDITNSYRYKHGITTPLQWDELAHEAALAHSKDMFNRMYFEHVNPEGLSPFDRMKEVGIQYSWAAENIARGYANDLEVMSGWIKSFGHRDNILNANLEKLGVGVYGSLFTQNFYSD